MKFRKAGSYLIVAICISLTLFISQSVEENQNERARHTIDRFALDSLAALQARLNNIEQNLKAGAGLFAASGSVTSEEWDEYLNNVEFDSALPGATGMGFVAHVPRNQLTEYLESRRKDGNIPLEIFPETNAGTLFPVQHIYPQALADRLLGLDFATHPVRRVTAIIARDTGETTITPNVKLLNDTESNGHIVFHPFYKPKPAENTAEARRAVFQGWVVIALDERGMFDQLNAYQDELFRMKIYDVTETSDPTLLYSSQEGDQELDYGDALRTDYLSAFGRTWQIEWLPGSEYSSIHKEQYHLYILILGMALSIAVGIMLRFMIKREEVVADMVVERTRQLTASRNQIESILNNTMIAVLLLDEEQRIMKYNKAVEQLLGRSHTRLEGMFLSNLIPGYDRKMDLSNPIRLDDADGNCMMLDLELKEWRTNEGIPRYTALIRDVTESFQAGEKIRALEIRWNKALVGSQIGVFEVATAPPQPTDSNPQKHIVASTQFVSETWRKLSCTPKDMSNHDAWELFWSRVHPDDAKRVMRRVKDCVNGITDRAINEFRVEIHKGKYNWIQSNSVALHRDEAGRATRMIGTMADTTQLHEAMDAVKESQQKLKAVVENAPAGITTVTADGLFMTVNQAFCDFIGFSPDEIIGQPVWAFLTDVDINIIRSNINENFKAGKFSYFDEYPFVHKNGHEIWGLVSLSLLSEAGDEDIVLIAHIQDISERRAVDKIKGEFVATVSHELRTPLTSIKGALGLLSGVHKEKLDSGTSRLLDIANGNCERLIALVNDILDMEKLTAGKAPFHFATESAATQISKSVLEMSTFATQHGVTLIENLPKNDDCLIHIDQRRLQQVLFNLISNAIKFSEADGRVVVKLSGSKADVKISVIDNGCGIPQHFMKNIFQPFSQADSSDTRKKGGTGLGLNISKQIVEEMNGEIGFESQEGRGSIFWCRFPRADNTLANVPLEGTPTDVNPTEDRPQVLHVDDDPIFSELIQSGLQGQADFVNAVTLQEAKDQIAEREFSMMLLDKIADDEDTIELIGSFKKRNEKGVTVFLTGARNPVQDDSVSCHLLKSDLDLSEILERIVSEFPAH